MGREGKKQFKNKKSIILLVCQKTALYYMLQSQSRDYCTQQCGSWILFLAYAKQSTFIVKCLRMAGNIHSAYL